MRLKEFFSFLDVETPLETYLRRLSNADRENVISIREKLSCPESLHKGVIIAVGSSLRRKKDWEDIDLVVLRELDVSAPCINREVVGAVRELKNFKIRGGYALGNKREMKPCLYLSPNQGSVIHLILSYHTDSIPEDDFSYRQLIRLPFSRICYI